jgi:uncharacterized protein YcbK (DUF882 family)
MKLNFTMSELLHSDTAKIYGINNIPYDPKVFDNMLTLILEVLQPLRNYIGKPIIITSGYRSIALNAKVGGDSNSQHITGQAADFFIYGLTIDEIIAKVKASGIRYDQLIHEGGWVHISYNTNGNRMQYLNRA